MKTTRRDALGHILVGGSGIALGCGSTTPRAEEAPSEVSGGATTTSGPLARVMKEHTPRPLPFDPASLDGLSERMLRSHHENNYAGAVRKLNDCRRKLAAAPADIAGFEWGGLAASELVFANSVALHELYFENLGGDGHVGGQASPALAGAFGTQAAWQEDFRRCAMSLAGGSGWVVLAWDLHRDELAHRVLAEHGHSGAMDAPLLVLDMYEHSFHIDFGADAGRYVEAFARNVAWEVVDARLARARGFSAPSGTP